MRRPHRLARPARQAAASTVTRSTAARMRDLLGLDRESLEPRAGALPAARRARRGRLRRLPPARGRGRRSRLPRAGHRLRALRRLPRRRARRATSSPTRDCGVCHSERGFGADALVATAASTTRATPASRCRARTRRSPALGVTRRQRRAAEQAARRAPGSGAPRDCAGCHEDPHAARSAPAAATCHTPASWEAEGEGARFDHARDTRFPLDALHAKLDCSRLPRGPRLRAPRAASAPTATPTAAAFLAGDAGGARSAPDPHAGAASCRDCHAESVAAPALLDYERACLACHPAPYGSLLVTGSASWTSGREGRGGAARARARPRPRRGGRQRRARRGARGRRGAHRDAAASTTPRSPRRRCSRCSSRSPPPRRADEPRSRCRARPAARGSLAAARRRAARAPRRSEQLRRAGRERRRTSSRRRGSTATRLRWTSTRAPGGSTSPRSTGAPGASWVSDERYRVGDGAVRVRIALAPGSRSLRGRRAARARRRLRAGARAVPAGHRAALPRGGPHRPRADRRARGARPRARPPCTSCCAAPPSCSTTSTSPPPRPRCSRRSASRPARTRCAGCARASRTWKARRCPRTTATAGSRHSRARSASPTRPSTLAPEHGEGWLWRGIARGRITTTQAGLRARLRRAARRARPRLGGALLRARDRAAPRVRALRLLRRRRRARRRGAALPPAAGRRLGAAGDRRRARPRPRGRARARGARDPAGAASSTRRSWAWRCSAAPPREAAADLAEAHARAARGARRCRCARPTSAPTGAMSRELLAGPPRARLRLQPRRLGRRDAASRGSRRDAPRARGRCSRSLAPVGREPHAQAARVWEVNGIRLEASQVERLAGDIARQTVAAVERQPRPRAAAGAGPRARVHLPRRRARHLRRGRRRREPAATSTTPRRRPR